MKISSASMIAVPTVISIAYIGIVWWAVGLEFLSLEPNSLGDFLAGAFAPLAFLWLVIAVVIQSRELAEQRKELALTREELVQTRSVMSAQADEARNQARFIGVQTEILESERDDRRRKAVDDTIESRLDALKEYWLKIPGGYISISAISEEGNTLSVQNFSLGLGKDSGDLSSYRYVSKICEKIFQLNSAALSAFNQSKSISPIEFDDTERILSDILQQSPKCSDAMGVYLRESRVQYAVDILVSWRSGRLWSNL